MKLQIIGLGMTVLLGSLSLLLGSKMANLLGYGKTLSPLGNIEFRATYGAFFVTLGVLGIGLNSQDVYQLIGACWLAAGITRSILFLLTRKNIKENLSGLIVEFGIATLLLFS